MTIIANMIKKINNPCNQCLVNPMCRNTCKLFERYLYELKKDEFTSESDTYYYLANDIRNGRVELYFLPDGKASFKNKDCEDRQ